jgi:hypothetical protein
MSGEKEDMPHTDVPDDDKAQRQQKTPFEQRLERYGENAKHIWRILSVILLVGGCLVYVCRNFIFPNWDWAVPSLLMLFGIAVVVVHRRWYPLLFVKGAIMSFSVLIFVAFGFSLFFGAQIALLPKGSPLPMDLFTRLLLWMCLLSQSVALATYATFEHIKAYMLAMSFGTTLLMQFVPHFGAMLWVVLGRLQNAEAAAGITSNPQPCSEEYIKKLAIDVATAMPSQEPHVLKVFEGYGWWDRQMKNVKQPAKSG